jgi:peptide subunit release factor 1 (eRF1)
MLIVAGGDLITGELDRTMPEDLKDLIIETIRLDMQATTEEIVDVTLPLAEQAGAERERTSVETVADIAQSGGAAVTGSAKVLDMLVQGRVSHLVINEDFHEDGWVDFVQQRYGAGENRDVFAGAADKFEVVPIIVEEEMVRLAIRSGAEIHVIHTVVPMKDEDPNRALPEGERSRGRQQPRFSTSLVALGQCSNNR